MTQGATLELIPVQFHLWPWSVEIREESIDPADTGGSFDFYGSPILTVDSNAEVILPSRAERFVTLGTGYISGGSRYSVFQMPHGALARLNGSGSEIAVKARGNRWSVSIAATGARLAAVPTQHGQEPEETKLSRTLKMWALFFDDLVDTVDKARLFRDRLPWTEIARYVQECGSDTGEPRMALIVKIAMDLRRQMESNVKAARKVLLREHRMLPMRHIGELDDRCLRWYIRQPGRNMAEKGGVKQKLMGIARRETHDTHENRILKDFLIRCQNESSRYLIQEVGQNADLLKSKRAGEVLGFKALCSELRRLPMFEDVRPPVPGTPPNYVLLNDYRYRNLYDWYKRLLRREEEKDRYWDWQARAWADITRMLVNLSLLDNTEVYQAKTMQERAISYEKVLRAALGVYREQKVGSRLVPGSEPGPFLLRRKTSNSMSMAVLEIVHESQAQEHSIAKLLGRTGGHMYLVLHSIGTKQQTPRCLVIWGAHTAAAERVPAPWSIVQSAARALRTHEDILSMRRPTFPELKGLVLCSDLDNHQTDVHFSEDSRVALVQTPTSPEDWRDCIRPLGYILNDLLGEWV